MKLNKVLKTVFSILILVLAKGSFAQNDAVIKKYGSLPYNGMAKILVRIPGPVTYDSIYFKNGTAIYNQDKYDGEIGWIYATDVDRNMVHYIVLEKGKITITATRDSFIFVSGTSNNDALFTLDEKIEPLRMKMKRMGREVAVLRSKGKNEEADKLQSKVLDVSKEWWDNQIQFATNNSNMAGLVYVNKLMSRFKTGDLKKILDNYKDFADKNAYKSVTRRYEAELKTDIGVVPPDFSLVSDKGQIVSLSSIKKKLTIIDFWASWCKPCRAENPNLISLYDKWKDKGLEIVSVSIDKVADKDKWLQAIIEDKINWIQVWDEKGSSNKDYGVTAIPRTFLVNNSGQIVAKDLRGEELNRFVEDFLGD